MGSLPQVSPLISMVLSLLERTSCELCPTTADDKNEEVKMDGPFAKQEKLALWFWHQLWVYEVRLMRTWHSKEEPWLPRFKFWEVSCTYISFQNLPACVTEAKYSMSFAHMSFLGSIVHLFLVLKNIPLSGCTILYPFTYQRTSWFLPSLGHYE